MKLLHQVNLFALFVVVTLWHGNTAVAEVKPYQLILDVDDTSKITHVGAFKDALWNGLWGESVFTGMAQLTQSLSKSAKNTTYLSGSPQSLTDKIHTLLVQKNG